MTGSLVANQSPSPTLPAWPRSAGRPCTALHLVRGHRRPPRPGPRTAVPLWHQRRSRTPSHRARGRLRSGAQPRGTHTPSRTSASQQSEQPMNPRRNSQLDSLIADITVDCYNDDEQLTAFEAAFDNDTTLSCRGTVIGEEVTVLSIGMANGRRELIATCEHHGRRYQIALLDIELDGDQLPQCLLPPTGAGTTPDQSNQTHTAPAHARINRLISRQRHDGVVLEPSPGRALQPQAMEDAGRTCHRTLRIPRDLSQPPAAALIPWHDDTDRIRASTPTDDSGLIPLIGLRQTHGTPEAPRNPGRFTSAVRRWRGTYKKQRFRPRRQRRAQCQPVAQHLRKFSRRQTVSVVDSHSDS